MYVMQERLGKPERFFPPGYAYEWERNIAGLLFAIGAGLSLSFFNRLYHTREMLCDYDNGTRQWFLRKGVVAASFTELIREHWRFYVPFVLFLAIMVSCHYFYYYRESKSIYLMRRLPRRGVTLGSCVKGPFLGLAVGAAALAALYLLYYGTYLLVIPRECLP